MSSTHSLTRVTAVAAVTFAFSLLAVTQFQFSTARPPSQSYAMMGGGPMGARTPRVDTGRLPVVNRSATDYPVAKGSAALDVRDGDTVTLTASFVRKAFVPGRETIAYAYNGQIPGPTLRAPQGATFSVVVQNRIDLPTTMHWHGLRLANEDDGVPGVTQPKEIAPGETYTYTVTTPDTGLFWYHPHVREDIEQDLGLMGTILVTPRAPVASPGREEILVLDDLLLDADGAPVPYGRDEATYALMGRYGNVLLLNGSPDYEATAVGGSVVRYAIVNAASARPFNVVFAGARMKRIGGDSGRATSQRMVDSVTLSPGERAVVDVLFPDTGVVTIEHRAPGVPARILGAIRLSASPIVAADATEFARLISDGGDVSTDAVAALRAAWLQEPAKAIVLDAKMMGGMGRMGTMGGMSRAEADGMEWDDPMPMMNATASRPAVQWVLRDQATGLENGDFQVDVARGTYFKLRLVNPDNGMHPMQHPIHLHGNRFLVVADNGSPPEDVEWRDTVTVRAGHTVDILIEATNPGIWMLHCHNAEHLSNGMMTSLRVRDQASPTPAATPVQS